MNGRARVIGAAPRIALTVLLAATLGGAIPRFAAAGNVISACAQKENGQLRVLMNGGSCRPSEVPISWGIQGPQGEPGEQGAMGDSGVSGLERVSFSSPNNSDKNKKAFARCPEGKHVVGGGAQIFVGEMHTVEGPIALKKSLPSDGMDGWAATAEEITPTDLNWFLTSYALCAMTH